MQTVHLIDNDHKKGWEAVFRAILKDIYGETLVKFNCLQFTDSKTFFEEADKLIQDNPGDIFILDNNLGNNFSGMDLLRKHGKERNIIFHTADQYLGFKSAAMGAKMFMVKDDPRNQMPEERYKEMIREFHRVIIETFGLVPELMWLVEAKINGQNE